MNIAPIVLTSRTRKIANTVAAVGPADILRAAFETGTPITLSGKHAGEHVYLGQTRQIYDDGIALETIGQDHAWEHEGQQIAAYLVDMTRLDGAPRLAEIHRRAQAHLTRNAALAEERIAAEDERLDNLAEDGS